MSHPGNQELLEDEGAGYLISVSDLMAGLLFVFIITLMAYVLSYQRATQETAEKQEEAEAQAVRLATQRDQFASVVDQLTNSRRLRTEMLERIRQELERLGVRVDVDTEHGILHLTEEAIQFESGQADLPPEETARLGKIGEVLARVLPCYAAAPAPPPRCDPAYRGKLESVFIEGHTDNVPYTRGRFADNWELSAQRAIHTYRTMVLDLEPELAALLNTQDFPIFSVAGYGEGRPREGHRHAKPVADPANRRIDLRFIMTPPRTDVAPVRELQEQGL